MRSKFLGTAPWLATNLYGGQALRGLRSCYGATSSKPTCAVVGIRGCWISIGSWRAQWRREESCPYFWRWNGGVSLSGILQRALGPIRCAAEDFVPCELLRPFYVMLSPGGPSAWFSGMHLVRMCIVSYPSVGGQYKTKLALRMLSSIRLLSFFFFFLTPFFFSFLFLESWQTEKKAVFNDTAEQSYPGLR